MKVHSDIAEALGEGTMTALIMLDLTAAVDAIDHPILLKHFESSFGFKENALALVNSVVDNNHQM